MKIQVLGCSGDELPHNKMAAFLIDDIILLDAGTIGEVLPKTAQRKIRHILVTHPHLDHVKAIPFFVNNIHYDETDQKVVLYSHPDVIAALKGNLFNDLIWPDFTMIPFPGKSILTYREVSPEVPFKVDGYVVTAFGVHHTTPAVGFLIRSGTGKGLLYTGDTGPTEDIWRSTDKSRIDALIVEVSFQNSFTERAMASGHLTPELLGEELVKVSTLPERIFITHSKPGHKDIIEEELAQLGFDNIELLEDGQILVL